MTEITTWYYEMLSPDHLSPARTTDELVVRQLTTPLPRYIEFLWHSVGDPWNWNNRSPWVDSDWETLANDANVHVWIGYIEGAPAGYFELRQTEDQDVEILYFGLLPQFVGKGYGGHLLSEAIAKAWSLDTKRVWVHTCNEDAPQARANYEARGFKLYDTKVELATTP